MLGWVIFLFEEPYKGTVYIRTNQKIQTLNQAYHELAQGMINVEFINVFDHLLGEDGQLKPAYTTDGLHLTIEGYRVLSKALPHSQEEPKRV